MKSLENVCAGRLGLRLGPGPGPGERENCVQQPMKIQDDARDKKTHRRRRQQSGRLTVWQPGRQSGGRGERGQPVDRLSLGQLVVQLFQFVSQRRFNVAHIIHSLRFYYFMFVLFVILTR